MTAGELYEQFKLLASTMSAHFSLLRGVHLIEAVKSGTTVTYRTELSMLQRALLGFAEIFEIGSEIKPLRVPALDEAEHAT